MSVQQFNPNQVMPVTISDAALAHLKNQVKKQNAAGIYFSVKESGCSGYQYMLEIADTPREDETAYAIDDELTLYVSAKALPIIQGTEIDYVQQGINRQLKFSNPNATAWCGCGESFSVER